MSDEVRDQGCDAGDGDDGCDDLFIRRISRELQAPVRLSAEFDANVMAAIRASGPVEATDVTPIAAARGGAARRAWQWVARPRTVRVSPLAGLAVAAGIAGVLLTARGADDATPGARRRLAAADTGARQAADSGAMALATASGVRAVADTGAAVRARPAVARAERDVQMVAFVLVAPDARQVAIVGDFNDWNAGATPLKPVRRGGVWAVTVPLKPGKYSYNFVVDGTRWMPDPAAPAVPADDFGTPASVVTVAGAQS